MNAHFALETLLRASLWGALAIGAVWMVCFVGRHRLSAGVRAWIWRLALAKMVLGLAPLSPLALSLLPPIELAPQPQKISVAASEAKISPNSAPFQPAKNLEIAPRIAPVTSDAPFPTTPPKPILRAIPEARFAAPQPISPPVQTDWPLIALIIWAFGALVQAIQLARGYSIARGLRRAASPLENELTASITAQCCARLRVRHAPQLAISTAGPLLLGTIRPLILLPEPTWHLWNEAELRLILAHEIAHHKRADLGWNFLLGGAQILFYFHPLLWIARREWRACCEQACDELTLRGSRESAALYGALLLRLATQTPRNGPAMVGVSEDFAFLQRRLMELKFSNTRRNWPRSVVALSIFAGAASLLPWQLTARAQIESPPVKKSALEGTLRDTRGRVVADANVFVLGARGNAPFLHTGPNGYYQLSGPSLIIPATDLLYVQGQTEGFARFNLMSSGGKFGFSPLQWLPTSVPKLAFVDEANRPVAGWEMRVWSIGTPNLRRLPPFLSQRFSARTDARGEISFPPLPQGMTIQLESGDTDWVETVFGLPDRRGTRFARLGKEDLISLQGAETRRTIRLLQAATLSGQVRAANQGAAKGAAGVVVFARYLGAQPSGAKVVRGGNIASIRTDAQGRYQMNGLRPGQYQLEISPDSNSLARVLQRQNRSRFGASSSEVSPGDVTPYFTRQESQKTLKSGQNQVDFQIRDSKTLGKSGPRSVSGRVVGPDGLPVAGATTYLMVPFRNGDKPPATMKTDAQGRFLLRDPLPVPTSDKGFNVQWGELFVDAGTRGMTIKTIISVGSAQMDVQLLPPSTPKLKFVDDKNRPIAGLGVRLWKVGVSSSYWNSLPAEFLKKFARSTDARGEITFPPLPQGRIAQFMLADEKQVPGHFMDGDHRGTRFAPLSTEDFVTLNAGEVRKTIHLLRVVNLSGVVKVGSSGAVVGNVQVVARRINAAEARGDIPNRDMLMASTRSNARGVYRLDGLRPGNYYLWLYPEKRLTRDWASLGFQKPLVAGINRVDFPLSKGAIIEGRVVSAATGKPVTGQTLGLDGPETNSQYEISGVDGRFRFRTGAGKQHFWVHGNGQNSPPPGYILPVQNKFDFSLKEGQTKTFLIQLPGAAATKPITGRVVGPTGAPVAGAKVESSSLGSDDSNRLNFQIHSDASGRFIVPAAKSTKPVRLFAASGELQTARGTVAVAGDDVTLKVEAGVAVTIAGRVVDERTKAPLPGVRINLTRYTENLGRREGTTRSDSQGHFEFPNLRPRENYALSAERPNYAHYSEFNSDMMGTGVGERREVTISLRDLGPDNSFAKGRVLNFDGTPAVGLPVRAQDANPTAYTDNLGNFTLRGIPAGPIALFVFHKGGGVVKAALLTTGIGNESGRNNQVIRLEKPQNKRELEPSLQAILKNRPQIGQIAPPIRAAQWFYSAPLSLEALRGQVVLLDIKSSPLVFWPGAQPEVEEIARAFAPRGLRLIGVQDEFGVEGQTKRAARIAARIRRIGLSYPIALDAVSANPLTLGRKSYPFGTTTRAYGMTPRVVIDRAGRIAYIGDSLSDAVSVAVGLLAESEAVTLRKPPP